MQRRGGVTTPVVPSDLVPGGLVATNPQKLSFSSKGAKQKKRLQSSTGCPQWLDESRDLRIQEVSRGFTGFSPFRRMFRWRNGLQYSMLQYFPTFSVMPSFLVLTLHFHVGKSHGCFYIPIIPNISPLWLVNKYLHSRNSPHIPMIFPWYPHDIDMISALWTLGLVNTK
jgi:hypothetical protein